MAKNKFNKDWLNDHLNDPYVKMAQKEVYRARAAYKLKEMDEAEKLLRPGMLVVDLGSAPGSWSQYLRTKLLSQAAARHHAHDAHGDKDGNSINGRIIALDLLPMAPIPGVQFIEGDFRETHVVELLQTALDGHPVDVVVSDMAPNLSGIESADMARIAHVYELALEFSLAHLRPEGALLVKAFHGSGYSQIVELFKRTFNIVKPVKPKASRDKSSETFLL